LERKPEDKRLLARSIQIPKSTDQHNVRGSMMGIENRSR
jgi:hypothetical protein